MRVSFRSKFLCPRGLTHSGLTHSGPRGAAAGARRRGGMRGAAGAIAIDERRAAAARECLSRKPRVGVCLLERTNWPEGKATPEEGQRY